MVKKILSGQLGCNSYIYTDKEKNRQYIIDPGTEPDKVLEKLDYNADIAAILCTHGHWDHIACLGYLKNKLEKITGIEIPIYIGEGDSVFISKEAEKTHRIFFESIGIDYNMLKDDNTIFPVKHIPISKSHEVDNIKLIHTPGHSPGSICIYIENKKILFSGDTLFYNSIGRTDFILSNYNQLLESIRTIIKLPDETMVYPGHGEKTTIGREKKHNPFIRQIYQL